MVDHTTGESIIEESLDEAQSKLEAIRECQGSMGWRWFVAELVREVEVIKEQLLTVRGDEAAFLQGKAEQCQEIIHFEDVVDNYLDMIEKGEAEENAAV